jgi:N-hydroxyarylamine O-acetyltransferase
MGRLAREHERYLRVLGFDEPAACVEGLRALVHRHLCRVPFENVSKLLLFDREGGGRPTRLEEFLDGIEHRDLGGTCYSSNPFLADLLRALGYDATLLAADMSLPDVHTSIRVVLDGAEYHVDVGYAAPFREPIRLDRLPYAVAQGGDRYVLDRDSRPGAFRLSMTTADGRRHGYVVHPPPRAFDFFARTIRGSFRPGATFMRCLRISRCFKGHTVDLRNRRLTISRGEESEARTLDSLDALRQAIDTEFRMPRCPVDEAVAILERLTGQPFFGPEAWPDSLDGPLNPEP